MSGQQCQVETSCGTVASAQSFFGSPDEVRTLRWCDDTLQESSSCTPDPVPPTPVTAQNCSDAWYESGASNSCYSSASGTLSVTVSSDQCSVSTPCRTSQWGSEMTAASFSETPEQVKTLSNCGGTLKAGSC